MRKVIITRPLAQAYSFARRVSELGREPVLFPLLEIHPLLDFTALRRTLDNLENYAMVVFVSPNAIDAVFSLIKNWPSNVAIAVMGAGSRNALDGYGRNASNTPIVSPLNLHRTDSQTLLEVLDLEMLRGKKVLIVRGETGREWLAGELQATGIQVDQVAAYRRMGTPLDQTRRMQLTELLTACHDWVITSSEALRILMDMTGQIAEEADIVEIQQQTMIVPHVRIAETAQMLGFQHIILTGSGDDQLLAALQS